MKRKLAGSLLIMLSVCVSTALAQKTYTPEKGSAERAAILSALRVPVERDLKQKIQFSINNFRVRSNWAFLDGEPQNPSGGKPNYKGTKYQEAISADMFDNNFFALLRKTGGRWKVVKYRIGCTDVCYLPWLEDYKAPKTIFPVPQ